MLTALFRLSGQQVNQVQAILGASCRNLGTGQRGKAGVQVDAVA